MTATLESAFARRVAPGLALADAAGSVAEACRAIATRIHQGGTLIAFGTGAAATDAAHLAVEFLHPVVVGTPAVPAMSLANDPAALTSLTTGGDPTEIFAEQLRLLGQPADAAVAIISAEPSEPVRRGLTAARDSGLLTVALTSLAATRTAPPLATDHTLVAQTCDPRVAKEIHVTAYHILWEMVHVFLDRPSLLHPEVSS